jgi:hypothetical protein
MTFVLIPGKSYRPVLLYNMITTQKGFMERLRQI